eukprot:2211746-Prymnesium_polylepis.1
MQRHAVDLREHGLGSLDAVVSWGNVQQRLSSRHCRTAVCGSSTSWAALSSSARRTCRQAATGVHAVRCQDDAH